MNNSPSIMVIGGGITGLSAAFYLDRQLKAQGLSAKLSIVEKGPAFGGKIHTLERDGFVIEKGPDSFLARKKPIIDLTRELGLVNELTGLNPATKKTYIVREGKLHRMPPGLVLGIPTEIEPFMETELLTPAGKIRALTDMVLPKRESTDDESLGQFLERRLGKEVLDNVVEPLLAGIYAGDTYALSMQATFPQFQAMEQKYRSLILGMMATRNSQNHAEEQNDLPEAARNSMFLTYRKGLQTLVNGLLAALDGAELRTGEGVAEIRQAEGGGVEVLFEDGHMELVDNVIVTTPTHQAAGLLSSLPAAAALKKIDYVSVSNVIMAFNKKDIPFELDGSGFLVPRSEGRTITASTWTSSKWVHTAPEDKVLIRCYIGRSGEQEWLNWSDDELVQKARFDLSELIGLTAEPIFHEITRMPLSMPQYPVGHLDNVVQFRKELAAELPGVYVTGAGFHGVGLPDCIRQGKEAALQIAGQLAQNKESVEVQSL